MKEKNCTFSEHFHQIFNLKRKILLFIKFLMFWGFQNCPWCDFIMSGSHLIWFLSFVSLLNHVNWNILDFDIWLSGDFVGHCIDFWSKFLLGTKIAHVWEENESLVISIWDRECIKAGQLYKSPLHRLKLDKTGLNWPKLVKTGLFQIYHCSTNKIHLWCLKLNCLSIFYYF